MLSHKLVLTESKNFTSDRPILAPPTIPINHYFRERNQQNRTEVLDYYSMLMYSEQTPALNTQLLALSVTVLEPDALTTFPLTKLPLSVITFAATIPLSFTVLLPDPL